MTGKAFPCKKERLFCAKDLIVSGCGTSAANLRGDGLAQEGKSDTQREDDQERHNGFGQNLPVIPVFSQCGVCFPQGIRPNHVMRCHDVERISAAETQKPTLFQQDTHGENGEGAADAGDVEQEPVVQNFGTERHFAVHQRIGIPDEQTQKQNTKTEPGFLPVVAKQVDGRLNAGQIAEGIKSQREQRGVQTPGEQGVVEIQMPRFQKPAQSHQQKTEGNACAQIQFGNPEIQNFHRKQAGNKPERRIQNGMGTLRQKNLGEIADVFCTACGEQFRELLFGTVPPDERQDGKQQVGDDQCPESACQKCPEIRIAIFAEQHAGQDEKQRHMEEINRLIDKALDYRGETRKFVMDYDWDKSIASVLKFCKVIGNKYFVLTMNNACHKT